MQLLDRLFGGPGDLLRKAKRDKQKLIMALQQCDEVEVKDHLFNFAVTVYHIIDWLKAYRPELGNEAYGWLNSQEALQVCRDLCNASKHVVLDSNKGGYRSYPAVTEALDTSAIASTTVASIKGNDVCTGIAKDAAVPVTPARDHSPEYDNHLPQWRLKVQLKSGQRVSADEIAERSIVVWEQFFEDHDIEF
ncbi:MAG: hypothetical protein ACHBNF_12420 [Chromatiales bacterium]